MAGRLIQMITSGDSLVRNGCLDAACERLTTAELLSECEALDRFWSDADNLYERVRALLFLHAIHRFHLPDRLSRERSTSPGLIPFEGFSHLLDRRFAEAIDVFRAAQARRGVSDGLCSALAQAYRQLAFQTLADQVRRSVRSFHGNQWMFQIARPADHPLRIRPELMQRRGASFPTLAERTPVRMDLSHSAWSDIFFLAMDYPEGARVLNVSIDLAVRGRDNAPRPPIETSLRVIDEPILRLISVDLGAQADITTVAEVFDFNRDYLGLLKAAVIAAGIIPPSLEDSPCAIADVLTPLLAGTDGDSGAFGIEIVSKVNDIPKGSRLAVSTNLLASLIALCMRATGQTRAVTGPLEEQERRLVAARSILGEWLAGSGGGWQDSGGLWPGMKRITGALAGDGDPEFGISRGRLLPNYHMLTNDDCPDHARAQLCDSLVLVHGGMAQDVGPVLEMVTEKYLLRCADEWQARRDARDIFDRIVGTLRLADIRDIGAATTHNFLEPIRTIIPWASNLYAETLIQQTRDAFGDDFWGFWMLGGMAGGGMGFIFDPKRKAYAQDVLHTMMCETKQRLEHALPFAMEPVVYDFAVNNIGTCAELNIDREAPARGAARTTFSTETGPRAGRDDLIAALDELGFDREYHEQIRADLQAGRIGLAQNRLPAETAIEDVREGDVVEARSGLDACCTRLGDELLAAGTVAVVTLAAGVGSRWTEGAGVVKALHPFCKLGGHYRSFLDVHFAKTRRASTAHRTRIPHVVTTSYLTHDPIAAALRGKHQHHMGPLVLSPGRTVGLRLVPTVRDLRFAWEQMPQQVLDQQQQKVRDSLRAALMEWARATGEGADYTDNVPLQCLHPVGHWYEIPNMLRNGVLARLLDEQPNLKHLMLHNIDTLGADVRPDLLGLHAMRGDCLTFEVIGRRIDDRGGGLARMEGRVRLIEGLAMPREEDEFSLSYYNTATTWINIDKLLGEFHLSRADLTDDRKTAEAVRRMAGCVPTYITLKDVKKRWGHGQEDIYPVAQFEKLWTDMTALPEIECGHIVVSRERGQQLKEQAQLDGWVRDGSAAYVESLCDWV
ncbi:MAG: UTP--glucose-1-phosphate uridylyltransferase [Phycisphaerales bacterium]|nr:UTP--glucose-1-phosphate uridylyltransferase [Phycisphaerales bacterium]